MLGLSTYEQIAESYPMLKFAKDIIQKYQDKVLDIKPRYHFYVADDGKVVLEGYCVVFSNGLILSVLFGFGSYSPNKNVKNIYPDNQMSYLSKASSAEIAILENDELLCFDDWNDSVLGYQSPDEIMQIIEDKIRP